MRLLTLIPSKTSLSPPKGEICTGCSISFSTAVVLSFGGFVLDLVVDFVLVLAVLAVFTLVFGMMVYDK